MKRLAIIIILNITIIIAASPVASATIADSVREGNELYKQEKYDDAIKNYNRAKEESPESDIINFNLGTALYKKGEFKEALDAFTRALNTEDKEIEEKAIYNMANSKYQLGNQLSESDLQSAIALYRESLDYYKRAIELNQNDVDAKYNHEFVERQLKILLDRLKNQPPQEKQDKQQNEDDQQDPQQAQGQSEKGEEKEKEQHQEQVAENAKEESVKEEDSQTGEESSDKEEGQREQEETRNMSPEEARMLLEAYGQEEGREEMRGEQTRQYPNILKDW